MRAMQRIAFWSAAAAIACMAQSGWTAESPPGVTFGNLSYLAPGIERNPQRVAFIPGSAAATYERAISNFEATNWTIGGTETGGNELVVAAYYEGEPSKFVDCGIVAVIDKLTIGRFDQFEGQKAWSVYGVLNDQERYIIDRKLQLHARIILEMTESFGNTLAKLSIQYILTQISDAYLRGDHVGTRVETIEFTSDAGGRSTSGLFCVATGELEKRALELVR